MAKSAHIAGQVASRYFNYSYHPNKSRLHYLRWAATLPFRSRIGGAAIAQHARGSALDVWGDDFGGKRTLIVGSGPSLDKVGDSFFAGFDTIVYINFALSRAGRDGCEYFFTTDSGPISEFIDAKGVEPFQRLGAERCVFAPVFQDQWQGFTPEGRKLFTWLTCDKARWSLETRSVFRVKLPFALRYHPRQPDWERFSLPESGRKLPILNYTSALSAVLFAAVNGSQDIGLIGCDLSAGRAAIVGNAQADPGKSFTGAAVEFNRMASALAQSNVNVVNHSWLV